MAVGTTQVRLGSARLRSAVTVEVYTLWLLIALELATILGLRRYFRRQHGG